MWGVDMEEKLPFKYQFYYIMLGVVFILQLIILIYLSIHYNQWITGNLDELSYYYKSMGYSDLADRYLKTFYFFQKSGQMITLFFIVLMSNITNFFRHRLDRRHIAHDPKLVNDFKIVILLDYIQLLLSLAIWCLFMIYDFNLDSIFLYIIFSVVLVPFIFIFSFVSNRLSHKVQDKINQIKEGELEEEQDQNNEYEFYEESIPPINSTYYVLIILLIGLVAILSYYVVQTFNRYDQYQQLPTTLILNQESSTHEEEKFKVCYRGNQEINCRLYDNIFSNYQLDSIKIMIDDQTLINTLTNSNYQFKLATYYNVNKYIKEFEVYNNSDEWIIQLNHLNDVPYDIRYELTITLVDEDQNVLETIPEQFVRDFEISLVLKKE